jgi:hypothetical protein
MPHLGYPDRRSYATRLPVRSCALEQGAVPLEPPRRDESQKAHKWEG